MKNSSNNPWAARFEPLLDREIIRQRALVTVPKLKNVRDSPTELALTRLEDALNTVFYPTIQCIDFLQRYMGVAQAHCVTHYADRKGILEGVYAKDPPLAEFVCPFLLTSLSGTGKTQLLKALRRIQVPDSEILVDAQHTPFPLKGSWHVTVQARSRPTDLLRALAETGGSTDDLIRKCRKRAFRDGIPFLTTDEFQFATGSDRANTWLAQMLLSLGYIGIPWGYAANFSMLARLLRRPEEERQRLLSDPFILLPDHHDSEDWHETLNIRKDICPDMLTFDPVKDAQVIHSFTAGRNRATNKLLLHTFRHEHPRGGKVNIAALRRTYHSPEFASYREESEILANQAIQNRPDKNRKDLWCPIPLPKGAATRFTEAVTQIRNEQVADAELRSALTKEEREALKQIERGNKSNKKQTGKVVPLRKKKSAPTAEDLKNNANWFKSQL